MYKALVNFCGTVSMGKGEIKEISDKKVANDLINAGYIEAVQLPKKDAKKLKK